MMNRKLNKNCFSVRSMMVCMAVILSQQSFAQSPPAPQPAVAPTSAGQAPTTPNKFVFPNSAMGSSPAVGDEANLTDAGSTMFSVLMDQFVYEPRGRRDPFIQPIPDRPALPQGMHGPLLPLQKFELGQLRLTGIIWDVANPRAMIRDPSGMMHVVGPNTKLGPRNGYIAVIREGEIVVVETVDQDGRLVSTAQVVRIMK